MKMVQSPLELVGNTPLMQLRKFCDHGSLFGKCEFLNPGGSVKDRVARYILTKALEQGLLVPGKTTIVEATSGNTGIGMALVGRQLGCRVIIVMPENMSEERKKIIAALGAELILTPAERSLDGCLEKVQELAASDPDVWVPNQFTNPNNPLIHYMTTGPEIWSAMEGKVDAFVSGIGSGGTLQGVGKFLKEKNPRVRIIAVEPANNAALLGREPGLHQIQGIGDGFIPEVLDTRLIDMVITVTDEEAIETARKLARVEGLLVGTSSGANVYAANEVTTPGKAVVTVLADRAERYFSTSLI
ncbi:MAG: cysteine synthase A [Deltaproteobacteria bacterium HGW-Deltaproteobacteria-17]|nr:MAG: cysteine synthase A [Deltaproteobacteria bacterium HGW-Deltaproteobacteria-17]